jgi:hypothetical protein
MVLCASSNNAEARACCVRCTPTHNRYSHAVKDAIDPSTAQLAALHVNNKVK